MTYTYKEAPIDPMFPDAKTIWRTDENGVTIAIPNDPANSDYQAYLATLTLIGTRPFKE